MKNYQKVRCPKCDNIFDNKGGQASAVDWRHAKTMRNQYFTLKSIAAKLGVSVAVISRGFKDRGIK
jgi:hypothetical protein